MAEAEDAAHLRLLRPADEARGIGRVGWDQRCAALCQAFEDFRFGVGDGFAGTEEFQMRRGDGGDHRHMRTDERDQIANLARVIHAHLEHAILGVTRQGG